MPSVRVYATIVEDNTGIKSQLPVLLTEQGELSSVTDYVLKLEADGVSASVIKGFLQAVSSGREHTLFINQPKNN